MGAGPRRLSKDVSDHSPEECIWCPNQGRRAPDSRGFAHLQSCGGASAFRQNRKLPWSLLRPGTKEMIPLVVPRRTKGLSPPAVDRKLLLAQPRLELKCPGLTPLPGSLPQKDSCRGAPLNKPWIGGRCPRDRDSL